MPEEIPVAAEAFAIDELLTAILSRCATDGDLAAELGFAWIFWGNPEVRCSRNAMDRTAANGHLSMVIFLHENRTEGCTVDAMDLAAANGHLPIVTFLHHNRTEGCSVSAMNLAAANGHLPIVNFLQQNLTKGCKIIAYNFNRLRIITPEIYRFIP
ncbi:MAG: ankyrin repeat domain-containing protein [Sulfobacillus sp.]